jgi:hypothetical protein
MSRGFHDVGEELEMKNAEQYSDAEVTYRLERMASPQTLELDTGTACYRAGSPNGKWPWCTASDESPVQRPATLIGDPVGAARTDILSWANTASSRQSLPVVFSLASLSTFPLDSKACREGLGCG